MLPRIEQIISVEPYKIICLWNTGEKRFFDLEDIIKSKSSSVESPYRALLNADKFREVKLDENFHTIYWDNLIQMRELDGTLKPAPLDFCPDWLYDISSKSMD